MTSLTTVGSAGGSLTSRLCVHQTIFVRSLADRLPGAIKIASGLAFYAFVGSWIYSGFSSDLNKMLADFPEEIAAMVGGDLVGATGGYITSVMLNVLGPLVFVGLAASWGSGAIAGEESKHTAHLLFSQPVTRRQVLVNRAGVLVFGIAVAVGIFSASLAAATSLFSASELYDAPAFGNVVATAVHLTFFVVAIGMIALAVGSATGSKATGVAAGSVVAFVSYLINSFAPLTAAAGSERFTPWYLYNGTEPIDNGIDLWHLIILGTIAVFGLSVGVATVERRDLEPALAPLSDYIPGMANLARPRVSSVFARAMSERMPLAVVAGLGLGSLALAMSFLFNSFGDTMVELNLPAGMEEVLGGSSLGTASGWMNSEVLSIVAPLAIIGLAASVGADAVAGERDRQTLGLVLSASITRTRFVTEKLAALLCLIVVSVTLMALGMFTGSALAGLDLSARGILGSATQLGALALAFGALAAAIGTKLSRRSAISVTLGLTLASFLGQALLSSVDVFDGAERLNPWEYYIGNNPIETGLSIANVAVLLSLAAVASVAAVVLFRRAEAA